MNSFFFCWLFSVFLTIFWKIQTFLGNFRLFGDIVGDGVAITCYFILTMTLSLQKPGKEEHLLKEMLFSGRRCFWGYWCDGVAIAKGGVGGSAASPHEHFISLPQRVCFSFFIFSWHLLWDSNWSMQKCRILMKKLSVWTKILNFWWKTENAVIIGRKLMSNATCKVLMLTCKVLMLTCKVLMLTCKNGNVTENNSIFGAKQQFWEIDVFLVDSDRAKHAMRPTFGIGLGSSFAAVIGGGGDRGGRRSRSLLFLKKRVFSKNDVFSEKKLFIHKLAPEVSIYDAFCVFENNHKQFVSLFFLFLAFRFEVELINTKLHYFLSKSQTKFDFFRPKKQDFWWKNSKWKQIWTRKTNLMPKAMFLTIFGRWSSKNKILIAKNKILDVQI